MIDHRDDDPLHRDDDPLDFDTWADLMDERITEMLQSPPDTRDRADALKPAPTLTRADAFHDRVADRLLPPPTRETPIVVDATLPAIAKAVATLGDELRRLGLGAQAVRMDAIAKAVADVIAKAVADVIAEQGAVTIAERQRIASCDRVRARYAHEGQEHAKVVLYLTDDHGRVESLILAPREFYVDDRARIAEKQADVRRLLQTACQVLERNHHFDDDEHRDLYMWWIANVPGQ
jgi:hypothetical protein